MRRRSPARLLVAFLLALPAWYPTPETARASQLIDRNASQIELRVDSAGRALLRYRKDGRRREGSSQPQHSKPGSFDSPTSPASRPSSRSRATGPTAASITSSARSPTAANPVYGFRSTPTGVPLDSHGRNIYLDTLNSAYGPGWRRENSFLSHRPTGVFCYGLYRHGGRPPGAGER